MNEELTPPVIIAKLNFKGTFLSSFFFKSDHCYVLDCDGCTEPMITNFAIGSNQFLEAEPKKNDDDSWVLVVNAKVDYEILSNPRFDFVISNQHSVVLDIINIDDNSPSVIPITVPCEIEVNSSVSINLFSL